MKVNFLNFNKLHICFNKQFKEKIKQEKSSNKIGLNELDSKYFSSFKLSFEGNFDVPIYAINKDGSYKKYPSIQSAANSLGCTRQEISQILRGAATAKNGYTFVKADDIETKNLLGEIRVNKKRIEQFASEIDKSIYVIAKDGSYQRCETNAQAARFIGCSAVSITHALQGKVNTVKGYKVVPSSKIEIINKKDSENVCANKIREFAQSVNKGIYAINKDGSYKRFDTQKEAAKYLNCSENFITRILQGVSKYIKDTTFIKAVDIETLDNEGNYVADIKKIGNIAIGINFGIYAINKDGSYKRFDTQTEAAKFYGMANNDINVAIKKRRITKTGTMFVKSAYIDTQDDKGRIVPNVKKIEEIARNINKDIYVISKEGEYKKFASQKEAAKYIGCNPVYIKRILENKHKLANEMTVLKADDVEYVNSDGLFQADEEKIKKAAQNINRGYYVIKNNGCYQRLENLDEVSKYIGKDCTKLPQTVQGIINGVRKTMIVPACDVEYVDKDGNYKVNKYRITYYIKIYRHNCADDIY